MKKKFWTALPNLILAIAVLSLIAPPAFSFWYGDKDANGNPILGGNTGNDPDRQVFDIQGMNCGELEDAARNIANNLQGFDNSVQGETTLTINKPEKAWEGITLLSCAGRGCQIATDFDPDAEILYGALLIDMNGEFINGWLRDEINGIPAKLLPGGRVMGGAGGGFGGSILQLLNWSGNVLWEQEAPGNGWHHDYNIKNSPTGYYAPRQKPHSNGDRLMLTNYNAVFDDTEHISNFDLLDDRLCIFDKKGNLKWDWTAADHFEQMGFSDAAKFGIKYTQVRGAGGRTFSDWTHFNQAGWLGNNPHYRAGDSRFHPNNIIFDSRSSSLIGIIDHKTGEIVWKVDPDSRNYPFGQIIGPHTAHMVPDGLPGAGNIIVFDNGGRSDFGALAEGCDGTFPSALRDYSRFIEFDPTDYKVVQLYENKQAFTDTDGNWNRKFFSSFISSVQRLPNGNTLICEGNQARIFEITPENEIVWEYNANSLAGGPGVIGRALYRAYRYPKSWVDDDIYGGDDPE